MKDSNAALIKILITEDPLKSVESWMQDLQHGSNIVHPVVLFQAVSVRANVDGQ